ncbi:MAG: polynucleotide adenylyltransferase PcnB [Rubrivivax sp.]|nr:polynucleotide adenylyltransferase PcnB [Rubrivivax sp.]
MIKKFIQRLFGQGESATATSATAAAPAVPVIPLGARAEIAAAEHRIDPKLLDANAVRVVRTLKDAGYEAYVVGGAVRDLLVGLRPKDFDVATDATPEQVKALFRRAFIIGRRFRLVHVVFGRGREHETIEVSTFRAYLDAAAAEQVAGNERTSKSQIAQAGEKQHVVDAEGRVLRDNVWGPQIEDAARRDFTINAMYFDPVTQTVVDYHGGLADARARVLRMIGDPVTRYREDPVRILRVVRFAAKLGFGLETATEAPVRAMVPLLANVPISRLFDEMIKLLQTGHALASLEQMKRFGLVGGGTPIFPVLEAALGGSGSAAAARATFVRLALEDTDRRVGEGRPVAPSFLLACLLWHDVQERWTALKAQGEAPFPALQQAVDAVFDARIGDISGRGKLAADMREIWLMQPRFDRRTPSGAHSLAAQARFRAGYDFLRLRADAGETRSDLADWWEDFHLGNEEEREALLADVKPAASGPRARRGAAGAPAAAGDEREGTDDDHTGEAPTDGEAADPAAPRKRRRRRRRGPRPDGGAAPTTLE